MMQNNHRLLNALLCQRTDCTPVWLMRQAGRYLPEYRALRNEVGDFMQLVKNPELACEVTLQPLRRFDLDAAIIFSDILTIPDAMGLGLRFHPGHGPVFSTPITDTKAIARLPNLNITTELDYVMQAIIRTKRALQEKVPLIGFSGSPWTLATYMVEGQTSKTFSKIRALIYQDEKALHQLLAKLSKAVVDYLNAQIQAGVDVVMLFDTWGGLLSTPHYQAFSLQYMQHIFEQIRLPPDRPFARVLYTKQGGQWLAAMAKTTCEAIGVDWCVDLHAAREVVGPAKALQGNLDPCALYASPERIVSEVQAIFRQMGGDPGYVFNLGHGIYPDTDPDHVACLVDAVHQCSQDAKVSAAK